MCDKPKAVCWPVLLRVDEHAELLVASSAEQIADAQWRDDNGLWLADTCAADDSAVMQGVELIDSSGGVFSLRLATNNSIVYQRLKRHYLPAEIVGLVQQHAELQGHCCVAKIGADSIEQAVTLVEQLNE